MERAHPSAPRAERIPFWSRANWPGRGSRRTSTAILNPHVRPRDAQRVYSPLLPFFDAPRVAGHGCWARWTPKHTQYRGAIVLQLPLLPPRRRERGPDSVILAALYFDSGNVFTGDGWQPAIVEWRGAWLTDESLASENWAR